MTEADDQHLLRAASHGDRTAFEDFLRRHEAAVFRLLKASTSCLADAEDALQEAFLAAWKNAGSYRGGPSARAWIMTIARNALRRAHRRRAGEPVDFEPIGELGLQAGWGRDEALEGLARREVLERALDAIDGEAREVLVLRDLEGFSGDEVSEMLGISTAAMKSRLHRARLRFVSALREVTHG
jgi:RNA polymerase sigma-70 factor (ECF subfamily)